MKTFFVSYEICGQAAHGGGFQVYGAGRRYVSLEDSGLLSRELENKLQELTKQCADNFPRLKTVSVKVLCCTEI